MNNLTNPGEKVIVKYKLVGGDSITLSPTVVRQYLVHGNGKITDGEILMFISLCKNAQLDPFSGEAYLVKYGDKPAQQVVGKEAYMKRAKASSDYITHKAGVIVLRNNDIVYSKGAFKLPKDQLVGAWAEVHTRSQEEPVYIEVAFDEYNSPGNGNNTWAKKPCTMIRKVALVQALREAFPNRLAAMYTSDELPDQSQMKDVTLDQPKLSANSEVLDMPDEEGYEEYEPVENNSPAKGEYVEEPDGFTESVAEAIDTGAPDEEERQQILAQELAESQDDEPDWAK